VALPPDLPFGPGRKKLLLLVLLAALGAAAVVPVLRDLLDRRLHTVNDVHRALGIPPAGWQIDRGDTASRIFGDEQLRRLAAALLRTRDARGQRVFGFSACKPGAGTTTLVLELAMTLRALGHEVLVVGAHGSGADPRLATGRPGLHELLRGQAGREQVVAPATDTLPARVAACGETAAGPFALQRLDRLDEALQAWAREVDFVLVDMPPLLTSADAELLVRVVGHVLLVIEAQAVTRGEVQRAGRLLQVLDPAGVGVVVNRVAPFASGGYMRELMIESISGRRAATVFTTPRWRLLLAGLLSRPKRGTA
jgi:Mrp family chromosome partitioning ATPase